MVGLASPNPNLLNKEKGFKLMLSPKSNKAFLFIDPYGAQDIEDFKVLELRRQLFL